MKSISIYVTMDGSSKISEEERPGAFVVTPMTESTLRAWRIVSVGTDEATGIHWRLYLEQIR